ncbi:hypothetical protein ACFORL_07385 [Legionella dresdenensis]|uniref:Uncharacterized protein n=1 Tax=Legionella dresdenensis TaxID=450200 RepID=A0ABV8CF39_9GAMM
MPGNFSKDVLVKVLQKYEMSCRKKIELEANNLPLDVQKQYYSQDGNYLDINQIIDKAKTGSTLYQNITAASEAKHSSELHPALHLNIRRYNLANKLLCCFNTDKSDAEQIEAMYTILRNREKLDIITNNGKSRTDFLQKLGLEPTRTEKFKQLFHLQKKSSSPPSISHSPCASSSSCSS